MRQFHVITGLPRSGSTLLCNLLNQNPAFHASSTSQLGPTLGGVANFWSGTEETKAELIHNREATEERQKRVLRSMVEAWYADVGAEVVFDKGRGWIALADRFAALWPDSRMICCVRDPRDVMASVQRQHLRHPILDHSLGQTLLDRADALFAPGGMAGGPLTHLEDLIARRARHVYAVRYESLVEEPEREMRKLYGELKRDYFPHDFENVENVATDVDGLYLGKFPHEGSGEVAPQSPHWSEHVPETLAAQIIGRYPVFAQTFGYAS